MRPSLKDMVGIGDLVQPAIGNGEIPPPSWELKKIKLNGCHNRPPKPKTVTVQDGWIAYHIGGHVSRLPRMIEIPDPMSDDCHYDKARSDNGCIGCIHMPEKKA